VLLSAGASPAPAQQTAPLALTPTVSGQGTALLVAADASLLSPGGAVADAITFALPRGMRVDPAARATLCTRDEAAASACPAVSRIGFGRFIVAVRNWASWGGDAELVWSIDASLGRPLRGSDAASVVLTAKLLGAAGVAAFLEPALGTVVPATVTTVGRLVRRASGPELQFPALPARLDVAAPATAAPTRLELSLTAVRRTRENVVRRIKVRTLSGYEVRRIRDHHLVPHHLLRTPASCHGSWSTELRLSFPAGVKRTPSRIACS
jgi:hypothetical protein